MSRINTNVQALTAQRGLERSQNTLSGTLERLSTGLRINRGADDPAGLIASESLRSELTGIDQAIGNSQRASNVIATAEGALQEVAALLLNVKSLIVEAANTGALSREEIEANQLSVESAIESITRISNTTSFAGLKLLDGSLDYVTSGVATSAITAMRIHQANFGQLDNITVEVDVLASAKQAELQYQTSTIGTSITLEVTGLTGVETISFISGASVSALFTAVNSITEQTGVRAEWINSAAHLSGVVFRSNEYGSSSFVSVRGLNGEVFNTVDAAGNDRERVAGEDAIASINGTLASSDGRTLKLNTTNLDLELTLNEDVGTGTTNFVITEGGSLFQLGARVVGNQQVNIGVQSVAASKLGSIETGFLTDLVGNGTASLTKTSGPAAASKIIELAIKQVAQLRGRLGAFERNTLITNINSLSVTMENVTAAESQIRDADFALETSALTRAQILTQAGTSVLATANSAPQTVLALLQG